MGERGQGAVNIELSSLPLVGDQEWEGHSVSPAMYLRDVVWRGLFCVPCYKWGAYLFSGTGRFWKIHIPNIRDARTVTEIPTCLKFRITENLTCLNSGITENLACLRPEIKHSNSIGA